MAASRQGSPTLRRAIRHLNSRLLRSSSGTSTRFGGRPGATTPYNSIGFVLVTSNDEQRVPPEYALQKIDPAGHYRLAAAANKSPGDYAVSLFSYGPQQARPSEINALSYRDLQSQ